MMLQKAATNAYSWWWASHIRTKQSKWLEQNLQDTEEKVTDILEIIDNDGDSFAQRAEMYYNKKTEILNSLEEVFRSYRSLAVRFDHLSKDLQSANRTIASVFPDQLPYEMEDEDEDSQISDKSGLPKPRHLKKDLKKQSMFLSKKGQPKKASSGLNKEEALEEIDKLQKEMLALQTEREFMKSSYEYGYKKFSEIENQINEKQERVCELQDEFAIGSVIDDNEGRALMATRALKRCRESLDTLKEKHEQSTEEVRIESGRIRNASQKFEAFRNKFISLQTGRQEKPKPDSMVYGRDDMEASDQQEKRDCTSSATVDDEANERVDVKALRKDIEEKIQVGSDEYLTMPQLAENIDELVMRVIRLETAVFSEKALVKRLKSEADELQEHVKTLEEDKEALIEGSDATKKKINELEVELSQVKDLVKTVIEQNISLKTHLTEAICNLNKLSVKLQKVEATGLSQDVKFGPDDAKADKGTEEHETKADKGTEKHEAKADKGTEEDETKSDKGTEEHETKAGKGTEEHETKADKGTEEHETKADKGTEEHETKAVKGTEEHETKADKGSKEDETKADKGSKEDETKADKGSKEDETKADKGTEEHEIKAHKGTEEHETKADKGTEEHEIKADKGTEEHETKADKGTEEHETKADKGTEEHETKADKGTEEHETKADKGTEEHETKANKRTREHETKAHKRTEEHETKADKGTEEHETKLADKGTEEHETKADKGTEEHETKADKGTEEHETKADKGTEEHETKADKGTEEHETKADKGTEEHETKADKGTEEHETKADKGTEEHKTELASDDNSSLKDTGTKSKEKGKNVSAEGEKNVGSESRYKVDGDLEKGRELLGQNKDEKKHLPETASSIPDPEVEKLETDEEEQLYLNGLDDREKISTDEYSSLLKNYKEVRKKLNEVDKKNRPGLSQFSLQIKELKSTVSSRDGTIQSSRRKLSSEDENEDGNSAEDEGSDLTEYIQQSPVFDDEVVEQTAQGRLRKFARETGGHVSGLEDKIRSGIDDLLEENLEFWLRFSTSVHQIQKYQNAVQDLKAELSTLREKMNKEGSENEQSMKSIARPIYSHLREIQTELTLWLENNEVLKDQVHDRNLSLCNFQDEIAAVTNAKDHGEETGISVYETAKFQGEVLNMKQEIKKVGKELKVSFTRARHLKLEVEKIMADLEKEIRSLSSSTKTSRSRIPLQSFLFGMKLKNKKKTSL